MRSKLLPFFIYILCFINGNAQMYVMNNAGNNTTVNTCNAVIKDVGGNGADYNSNMNVTRTFCSNNGGPIRINVSFLNIEGGYDYLTIYNGPNTGSPVLASLSGFQLNNPNLFYTSTGTCITIKFTSDNSYNYDNGNYYGGFTILAGCPPQNCNGNLPASDFCDSPVQICDVDGYCGSTNGWYTIDRQNIDTYAGNSQFCGSIENNSWLSFVPTSSTVTFQLQLSNCIIGGTNGGIQFVLLQGNCNSLTRVGNNCWNQITGNQNLTFTGLTVGATYRIMVDGFAGDICNYTLLATSGVQTVSIKDAQGNTSSTICQGDCVNLTLQSSTTPTSYSWSSVPAGVTGSASTVSVCPTQSMTVSCTITGACGASSTVTYPITVKPKPVITANPNTPAICSGQSTGISLSSSIANTTYNWTVAQSGVTGAVNGSATGTGANSSYILNQTLVNNSTTPGTATYTITPTTNGCNGTPITVVVTVNPSPTMTTPPNQTLCAGQNTTTVIFSGTAGSTFAWTNNNTATGLGASGNGDIPVFVATNLTGASITSTITVTPTLGTCPGPAVNFTITVATTPTVTAPTSQTICAGASTSAINFTGTAVDYNWTNSNTSIGLGASGTGNIAAFVGTNSGTTPISGTITLTPVSGTCTGTAETFTITVNPSPTMTTPPNQTLCAGQSTTAVIFSGTAGSTFAWTNNNTATGLGASGNGDIPVFVATNSTSSTITSTITVTPTLGICPGPAVNFTITVATTPTVTAPTSQTICAGASTSAINFTGTAVDYNWTNSNTSIGLGASGTGNIASFVGINSGTTPISGTITVTPVSGTCSGTAQTFTITVNPSPTMTTPPNQTLCAGQSTTAVIFSGTAGSTFAWTNNNTATGLGASGNGDIPVFVATNSTGASITSTITVTPTLGTCPGTAVTFTITVAVTPTVTAPTSQTICAGASTTAINFTGTAVDYDWTNSNTSIGLGASGTGNIASFVGTNSGTTPISGTITVTPVSGTCTGTAQTFTITVNPSVTPTFTQLGPYCLNSTPGTLPLNSTNSPAISGTWNPTTISTSAIGTQTYTFTPNANQCALNTSMTISISALVTPTFTQVGPLCQNTAATLPTNSTNTPSIIGTWNSSTVNTTTVGTNMYTFTPNANQCASTATMNIQIITNPTITLTPQTICAGQTLTINPTVTPTGGNYLWSNNQTTSSITVSPTTTTTYSLLYSLSGCNASSTVVITVNPNVSPSFAAVGPYCQNDTPSLLSTTSTNGISGTWNPSVISTATAGTQTYTFTPNTGVCANNATLNVTVNPLITPSFNQIGTLCQNDPSPILPANSTNTPAISGIWNPSIVSTATVGTTTFVFTANPGQCASNVSTNITVVSSPQPTINANVLAGCAPLNVTLNTESLPNVSYNWSSNGVNIGTSPTLNTTFNNPGCYDISLTTSLGTCQSTSVINDYICVEATPIAAFNVFPNSFSNSTETAQFNNNSIGAISYSWNFGDGQNSTEVNPSHVYSGLNSNTLVTLTATSTLGCTSSVSVVIPYEEETIFYVPNTFTPDEDEFNQTWGPVFSKGFDEFNFNLYVYNRWGELIWESKDAKGRWDGNYGTNGLKCPQGVYTWKIDYKPIETDEKLTITGTVNLLR
ncbi:MAG: T9SS type B sorting domain-containing protein [Flavobacteriales bacterium]|nr:T9SS type B sorting domain-containing protein [Flavobacteriales bacterium]